MKLILALALLGSASAFWPFTNSQDHSSAMSLGGKSKCFQNDENRGGVHYQSLSGIIPDEPGCDKGWTKGDACMKKWGFGSCATCVDKTNERAGNCLTCTEGYKLVPLPGMGFNKGKCYGYCVNAKDKYHPHDGFDKTQWDYVAIGSDSEGLTLRVKTKEGKIQKNSKMWAKAYPGELTCDYSE